MSSLSAQLARIGTADRRGSGKAVASFLFDAREAADLDMDAVFALGTAGYADLLRLDPVIFSGPIHTLFSDKYRSYDRVLQTAEENKRLDDRIAQFLLHLSPYFLTQAAGKTVEWLLRRFRVNEFNIDALLTCALPYHETTEFGRLASLLRLEPSHPFSFLTQYRRPHRPLPRAHLLQRLLQDPALLAPAILGPVRASASARVPRFRALSAYESSFLILYLQENSNLSDALVTNQLLPHLLKSLSLYDSNFRDHRISSMMVLSTLSSRVALSKAALTSLLTTLVPPPPPPTGESDEAFTVEDSWILPMIHVVATQPQIPVFPKHLITRLLRLPESLFSTTLPTLIGSLSVPAVASRFLDRLSRGLVQLSPTDQVASHRLRDLILAVRPGAASKRLLSPSVIRAVIMNGITLYLQISSSSSSSSSSSIDGILEWLRPLSVRWGPMVGEILGEISQEGEVKSSALSSLVPMLLGDTEAQPLDPSNPASPGLIQALGHADASIRSLALERLHKLLSISSIADSIKPTLSTLLRDRLISEGEEETVVIAAARLPHLAPLLLAGLGPAATVDALIRSLELWSGLSSCVSPLAQALIEAVDADKALGSNPAQEARLTRAAYTLFILLTLPGELSLPKKDPFLSCLIPIWHALYRSDPLIAHPLFHGVCERIGKAGVLEGTSPKLSTYFTGVTQAFAEQAVADSRCQEALFSLLRGARPGPLGAGQERAALVVLSRVITVHALQKGQHEEALHITLPLMAHLVHALGNTGEEALVPASQAHSLFLALKPFHKSHTIQESLLYREGNPTPLLAQAFDSSDKTISPPSPSVCADVALLLARMHATATCINVVSSSKKESLTWGSVETHGLLEATSRELSVAGVGLCSIEQAVNLILTVSAFPELQMDLLVDARLPHLLSIARAEEAVALLLGMAILPSSSITSSSQRARALHVVAAMIRGTVAFYDWQLALPILLALMMDPADGVRDASLSAIVAIREGLAQLTAQVPPASVPIALTKALYGVQRGEHLRYLASTDALLLAQALERACAVRCASESEKGNAIVQTIMEEGGKESKALIAMIAGHASASGQGSTLTPRLVWLLAMEEGGDRRTLRALCPLLDRAIADQDGALVKALCSTMYGPNVRRTLRKSPESEAVTSLITALVQLPVDNEGRGAVVEAIAQAGPPTTFARTLATQLADASCVDGSDSIRRRTLIDWFNQYPALLAGELAYVHQRLLEVSSGPSVGGKAAGGAKGKKAKKTSVSTVSDGSTGSVSVVSEMIGLLEILLELGGEATDQGNSGSGTEMEEEESSGSSKGSIDRQRAWEGVVGQAFDLLTLLPTLPLSVLSHGGTMVPSAASIAASGPGDSYALQLALTLLAKAIRAYGEILPASVLRVDVVVRALQGARTPQTRRSALWLLAAVSSAPGLVRSDGVDPAQLLAALMPVFTFMGTTAAEADDPQTYQVMEDALAAVVPPLVRTVDGGEGGRIAVIMRVFSSAYGHIPGHRRNILFRTLIRLIGAIKALPRAATALLERVEGAEEAMSFTRSLAQEESVEVQVGVMVELIQAVSLLGVDTVKGSTKESEEEEGGEMGYLIIRKGRTEKQIRRWRSRTLDLVDRWMEDAEIQRTMKREGKETEDVLLSFLSMVTRLAHDYATYLTTGAGGFKRYWKGCLRSVMGIQSRIQALLPLPTFVRCIQHLLVSEENPGIRRKVLLCLNERMERTSRSMDPSGLLISLLPLLLSLVEGELETGVKEDEDVLLVRQASLVSLALLARGWASHDPETFVPLVPRIMALGGFTSSTTVSPSLRSATVICLTVYGQELGGRMLPYLPSLMPQVTECLKQPAGWTRSAVAALWESYLEVFPTFLTSYVSDLLDCILKKDMLMVAQDEEDEVEHEQSEDVEEERERLVPRVHALLSTLAKRMPPRLLLPMLEDRLPRISEAEADSVVRQAFFDTLSDAIATMDRTSINDHHQALFLSLISSLEKIADDTEKEERVVPVMRSLVQLVLKLSGAAFRPLFLQLVEWAGSIPSRRPILYRTLDTLIEALQSLMLPFLPPVLDDLFGYLEGQGSGKEEAWIWAVRLIHHALLYSEDDEMWSGGKLERLAPALVKQISQIPLEEEGMGDEDEDGMEGGTEQELELKRAIVQLAVTSGNDVVWKALNGQLLLQTRSEEASIRLAAVRTLTACWTRLGEEWLILLPETIPFLAELMEDEDERVESAVQVLTSEMERFLGEPMQKYFE